MEFEKYLCGTELNRNTIAKYVDGEKIVLAHEYKGKELNKRSRIYFESEEQYEAAFDNALVADDDMTYNKARALGALLDKFFKTKMLSD